MKPNIVFIMVDDLGYSDLSSYGSNDIQTPNIDRLAAHGVLLTNAYASSPICSPTRLALITGRYQYRYRAGMEEPIASVGPNRGKFGLDPDEPTMPSLLRAVGYRTALVGKWHLGEPPDFGPLSSGYDIFFGIYSGAIDYFSHRLDGDLALFDGDSAVKIDGYITDIFGEKAVELINLWSQNPSEPFLLSLHFTAPHFPWQAPGDSDPLNSPSSIPHYDGGSRLTYAKMVERVDHQVGQVLKALENNKLSTNTIVIFTSDNGGERFSQVWPFRGRKGQLLEGGIRVPAMVRWPERLEGSQISHLPVITMDWTASILEAAGVDLSRMPQLDGQAVWSSFDSGELFQRTLYWRFIGHQQAAIRSGNWKFLRIGQDEFLFDLGTDTLENANLIARYPDIADDLRKQWNRWNSTMLVAPPDAKAYCVDQRKIAGMGILDQCIGTSN